MAPTPHIDLPPRRLGNIELVRLLGRGGMASVYLGIVHGPAGFSRQVAVKLADAAADDEVRAMFLEEAALAGRLHHANVVGVQSLALEPRPYMVLEYVEGDSLLGLLRARRLPVPVVVAIVLDVLAGLHAAHELQDDLTGASLGLVHRDVSPQNILVGVDGVARIADFGVAYAAERRVVTRIGQRKGKPGYWAPEQAEGTTSSRRTDVFGAAVVLWEALVGRRMFPNKQARDAIEHLSTPTPPSAYRPELPPAVDEVILRALARDEVLRWPTAERFAEALRIAAGPPATRADVARLVAECAGELLAQRREVVRKARLSANVDDAAATSTYARLGGALSEVLASLDESTVHSEDTAAHASAVIEPPPPAPRRPTVAPPMSALTQELQLTVPFEFVEPEGGEPSAPRLQGWTRAAIFALLVGAGAVGAGVSGASGDTSTVAAMPVQLSIR